MKYEEYMKKESATALVDALYSYTKVFEHPVKLDNGTLKSIMPIVLNDPRKAKVLLSKLDLSDWKEPFTIKEDSEKHLL